MLKIPWLVRFIVPAFFLLSCSQKENISSPGIGDEDNLSAFQVDTFQIESGTLLRDSVSTSTASNLLVGSINSEDFGRVTCNSFLQTSLSGNNFITSADPIFDSMVLVLRPNYLQGNPDAVIKMKVFRLKEGFDSEKNYFSFDELEYDPKAELASVTFTARELQEENLRIRLDDLGQEFLSLRDLNFFQSSVQFVEYFKGLALVTETAEGSIIGFEVDPASSTSSQLTSGLFFHYKTSLDTTFYKFPISVNFNRFNQIIHERPKLLSDLKETNQLIGSQFTDSASYVMSGTGIISKLNFPTYSELRNQHRNLIVEQALLTIRASDIDNEYISSPDELFMFKLDSNQRIQLYDNGDVSSGIRINNVYSFDVTNYFSDLIYQRETITDFILIPSQNGSTINPLKFGSFKKNNSPIKLFVYYIPVE